jgi:hypothetical protein
LRVLVVLRYHHEVQSNRALLNCGLVFATLLSVVVATSVVHYHVESAHDNEVCTGHLDDDGSPDVEHGKTCAQCSLSQRYEFVVASPTRDIDFAPQRSLEWRPGNETQLRHQLAANSASPRAPPILSLQA